MNQQKQDFKRYLKRLIIIISLFCALVLGTTYEVAHINFQENQRNTVTIKSQKSILFFYREDCVSCKKVYPLISILRNKFPIQIINTNNLFNHKNLSVKYNVRAVPTLISIDQEKQEKARYVGSNIPAIIKFLLKEER